MISIDLLPLSVVRLNQFIKIRGGRTFLLDALAEIITDLQAVCSIVDLFLFVQKTNVQSLNSIIDTLHLINLGI